MIKLDLHQQKDFNFWLKNSIRKLICRRYDWSIGIYTGDSPFNLDSPVNITNPVLTSQNVTDVPAQFVADPFMVYENGIWYMFFEVFNGQTNKGEIGLATSINGYKWNYEKIVLSELFHLSYPYVFQFKNDYYLIPESSINKSIRLYKAIEFPYKWSLVKELLNGSDFVDTSVFEFNNFWWLLTTSREGKNLYLYYSDNLLGNWQQHPQSPVIKNNPHIARPGGRVIVWNGQIFRYTQDVDGCYGNQVCAYEIVNLTINNYEEKAVTEKPIIKASGHGWNQKGMHNIDPHQIDQNQWIACVDGYRMAVILYEKWKFSDLLKI
jgi:hypothetical protein